MAATECTFETADALALTSLGRKQWDNMMQRQQYDGAPAVAAGHPRYFDRDDMVSLIVLDHFIQLGMSAALAGRVASAVREELRKAPDELDKLWLVSTESGAPRRVVSTEPPSDMFRHEITIKALRQKIEKIAQDRMGVRR